MAEHLNKSILKAPNGEDDVPDRHLATFKQDHDIPLMFQSRLSDYKHSQLDRYLFHYSFIRFILGKFAPRFVD